MLRNYLLDFGIASFILCLLCMLVSLVPSANGDEEICINPNSTMPIVCSGRGECVAGVCDCHPRRKHSYQKYSGKYCQCDDFSCSYSNDAICGGHGRCDCGMCMCDDGYTGDACECPMSPETCLSRDGQVCNGVGECDCGVCRCNPDSSYKGPTCEECPTCPGKCSENKACAQCVAFMTGPYTPEKCRSWCAHVEVVDAIDPEEVKANDRMNLCQFNDEEDDCRYYFTYEYVMNNQIVVKVQGTKDCPKSFAVGEVGNGPAGGVPRRMSSLYLVVLMASIGSFILRKKC